MQVFQLRFTNRPQNEDGAAQDFFGILLGPAGTPTSPAGGHADHVTKAGRPVGVSSLAVYSYYYREMISQCMIDCDQAQIGNEVIIHWGDYGKRIKEIRATVSRFPYLDLPRNQDYDLSSVPSGVSES